MNRKRILSFIQKIIHWLLLIAIVAIIISGFGITQFRVVETITFGLLHKALAFEIHLNIWIPFVILLVLHIYFTYIHRLIIRYKRKSAVPAFDSTD